MLSRPAEIVFNVILSCCVGASILGGAILVKVNKEEKQKGKKL